jgi:hypothetical protein
METQKDTPPRVGRSSSCHWQTQMSGSRRAWYPQWPGAAQYTGLQASLTSDTKRNPFPNPTQKETTVVPHHVLLTCLLNTWGLGTCGQPGPEPCPQTCAMDSKIVPDWEGPKEHNHQTNEWSWAEPCFGESICKGQLGTTGKSGHSPSVRRSQGIIPKIVRYALLLCYIRIWTVLQRYILKYLGMNIMFNTTWVKICQHAQKWV